ncbi:MAG TPA: GIY-YIG nuclease family protein [Candidatus Acidoferrales bacterium]|nr:GIY-YIG nuclease family protein [Candidatus Acidoferrales bacterium]
MDWHELPELVCGIYIIQSQVSHRAYIGQSIDVYMRITQHASAIRNGFHTRNREKAYTKMHADYLANGAQSFVWALLESCHSDELKQKEDEWIEIYMGKGIALYNNLQRGGRALRVRKILLQRLGGDSSNLSGLAREIGVNRTTLWRFLYQNYEPQRKNIRKALGLEEARAEN